MLNNEIKFEFKHGTFKNRLAALEDINKIERLKEQVKDSDFLILNSENEAIKYCLYRLKNHFCYIRKKHA